MLFSSRISHPRWGSRKQTSRSPPGRPAAHQKPEDAWPGRGLLEAHGPEDSFPGPVTESGGEGAEDGCERDDGGIDGLAC